MKSLCNNYPHLKKLIDDGTIKEYSIEGPQVSEILDCVLGLIPETDLRRMHGFSVHEQPMPYDAAYLIDGDILIDVPFFESHYTDVQVAVIARTLALLVLGHDSGARDFASLRHADFIAKKWGFKRELRLLGYIFGVDVGQFSPLEHIRKVIREYKNPPHNDH
jgi:hypothetical protein